MSSAVAAGVMPEETVSIRYARALAASVERQGVRREHFLDAADWTLERLHEAEGRVPVREFYRLCELALDLTGNPALGLRALHMSVESIDVVGQLAIHATTVRDAFEWVSKLHKLMSDRLNTHIVEDAQHVAIEHADAIGASPRVCRFVAEMHITAIQLLFRYFSRGAVPIEVSFRHDEPDYSAAYENAFAVPVRFDQPVTRIVFARELMNAARPYRDGQLHRTICKLAHERASQVERGDSLKERVRALVATRLGGGVDLPSAARALGISTRSLRRELASEGTSFNTIVTNVLAERAKQLLTIERRTIQEAAFDMGYSNPTSFHRAFKRWTGATPSAWLVDKRAASRWPAEATLHSARCEGVATRNPGTSRKTRRHANPGRP